MATTDASWLLTDGTRARARMVELQIAGRGIRDAHVLAALQSVPREKFVRPGLGEFAYEDGLPDTYPFAL